MPYGLANSSSIFQSFMYEVFRDMLHSHVTVYIDDILIYPNSYEQHVEHVLKVLHRLIENNLYMKGEKCEFHKTTLKFLGSSNQGWWQWMSRR